MLKILFLPLLLACVIWFSEGHAGSTFTAVVSKIIDGDSIVVKSGKKYIEVRFYGIDCPEWNQHSAMLAKRYIKARIYKKRVIVDPQYHDSYGRLVALIEYKGQDVNGGLVKSGMAWVYPKYCKKKVCEKWREDQSSAQGGSRGLWESIEPVPPWQWKRMHH